MANTSEEFTSFTNDFFTSFEYCLNEHYFGEVFYYATMVLCFFIGTPAHLWCLRLYFCTKHQVKETQVLLLNHTVMEIIYCLECSIETLNMFTFKDDTLWYISYFFFGLVWTGRPLLQTCICIEQYMAVIHPVTFLRYKGIKYRIIAAVVTWLMAIAYGTFDCNAMMFPDLISTFVFIITLAVISFCCVSVLCALKHPGPGDTHNTQQTDRNGGNQQKRNAFNTIFSALLVILFTYFPQAILVVFTGNTLDQVIFTCTIAPFMASLNVFGVIISPLLKLYKESHKNV